MKFHKQKLLFHRASMKKYFLEISKIFNANYIEYSELKNKKNSISYIIEKFNLTHISYYNPVDFILEKRINKAVAENKITEKRYESPLFIYNSVEIENFLPENRNYLQNSFYIKSRRRLNILLENNKPVGGKWSYDADNRKKLPNNIKLPIITPIEKDVHIDEAINYINTNFKENPGLVNSIYFSVDSESANNLFEEFLNKKFFNYGIYQDSISKDNSFLFHSLISPYLNSGLLSPNEIVQKTIDFASVRNVPLNSFEGFLRQIIGWREYIRGIYIKEGVIQRTMNFWNFSNALPKSFYTAETGIHPIDITIKKLLETGYNHHIERLMVLGNFMLLCEINPNEVYKWFMEMYIDGYDWVMVPNVYGMSQFADGGIMSTKPYFSSSNYIKKMSNFEAGEWTEIWDALFWRFIFKQIDFFKGNPRLSILVKNLEKMDNKKLNLHLLTAEKYLNHLFS